MSKQVRRVSQLPEWFTLAKYGAAAMLDTIGWYEQLSVRRDLLRLVGSPRWKQWQIEGFGKVGEQTLQVLSLVRATPIADIGGNDLLTYLYGGKRGNPRARDTRYSSGVRLATVRDLYLTEDSIEPDKRASAKEFFGNERSRTEPFIDNPIEWIDMPIDVIKEGRLSELNICVNMLLPDNMLIEQFKRLLKSQGLKDRRKPDYLSWIRFGVLPYIDLCIWEKEFEKKIPNRVMADAIFPRGEGGEEVVRKTTAKLADHLLSSFHLNALGVLAAYEIAEQTTV